VITVQAAEIVSAVQDTARIPTHDAAEQAVHATLRAFGERLAAGETKDLASQLPPEFATDLPSQGAGERFSVDEFYQRVASYESGECTPEEARRHARAVAAALKASLTGREFDQISGQLPAEYDDLLGTGPVQH
jgi:uncharacterized protein (DUF2267 family)